MNYTIGEIPGFPGNASEKTHTPGHSRKAARRPYAPAQGEKKGRTALPKKNITVLNLEEKMPSVGEVMHDMKRILPKYKAGGSRCLVLIHGYGSSGKGGTIRITLRPWLESQVKNGKIRCVVYGENFNMFSGDARRLFQTYQDLREYYGDNNPGITVAEL